MGRGPSSVAVLRRHDRLEHGASAFPGAQPEGTAGLHESVVDQPEPEVTGLPGPVVGSGARAPRRILRTLYC